MSPSSGAFPWSENFLQRSLDIKNSTRCSFWFMKILVQRWLTHLSLKIIPFKTSEVNAKNFIQITKHLFIEKSSTTIMNDSYQFQVPLAVWRERKRSKWAWYTMSKFNVFRMRKTESNSAKCPLNLHKEVVWRVPVHLENLILRLWTIQVD